MKSCMISRNGNCCMMLSSPLAKEYPGQSTKRIDAKPPNMDFAP